MGYPHYSGDCSEYHDLVRDFGPYRNVKRYRAVGSLAREAAGEAHRPRIVVLCGSTRFYDEFQRANYELTMAGEIVLSVGFYPHRPEPTHAFVPGGTGCCAVCDDLPGQGEHAPRHGEGVGHDSDEKVALDELHKRKIDLADRVYVLNVGGYIGESTRSEIEYAERRGTPVTYAEPTP